MVSHSKVEAETEKGEGVFPCFATGCQALSADPRAQWLKVFFFFFFLPFPSLADLSKPGIEAMPHALAGRFFFISKPPGKP